MHGRISLVTLRVYCQRHKGTRKAVGAAVYTLARSDFVLKHHNLLLRERLREGLGPTLSKVLVFR